MVLGMAKLPQTGTAGNRWAANLLLVLSEFNPDDWIELTEAHDLATGKDTEIEYSTQRNMKRELIRLHLLEQTRQKRHFCVRLTDQGREMAKEIDATDNWGATPDNSDGDLTPVRVGRGHLLPKALFARYMKAVNAGSYDLVFIPREAKTKTDYLA